MLLDLHPRSFNTNPDQYQAAIEKKSFDGQYTRNSVIVTLSIALGLYNSLELFLLVMTTFKKWKGLYFWSLTICNSGIMLYSIGMMLMYFDLGPLLLAKIVLDIGWLSMVICQSLVLYSRLNLILDNVIIFRAIKWYIIINSIALATTTIVLDFGVTYSGMRSFARAYFYIEHIQMTGFTLQEVIISGVYVWKTITLLQIISKANTRSMIWQLLFINILIIAMDIALIFLQFKHLQLYQESTKGFVYSVKLKLELNILSKLVDLVHRPSSENLPMSIGTLDSNTIVGQAQADVHREMSIQNPLVTWFGSDEKDHSNVKLKQLEDGQSSHNGNETDSRPSPPLMSHSSDDNEVTRVRSQTSAYSARANGRESDMLYADMLRSISKT